VKTVLTIILGIFCATFVWAEDDYQPQVGRDAAARYFQKKEASTFSTAAAGSPHFLSIHVGKYMASQSYEWGKNGQQNDVGGNMMGVTYRIGEWKDALDWAIRIDYSEYLLAGDEASKLSFISLYTFPDASSRFPLYFGGGLGAGVFFRQVDKKSPLSLDYQLILGARFFDIFENSGFFVEAGLKNHVHLLSTGQFNGTFLTSGMVFTF
jgi:hypothetical protein